MSAFTFADEIDDVLNEEPIVTVLKENGINVTSFEVTNSLVKITINNLDELILSPEKIDASLELLKEEYPDKDFQVCFEDKCITLTNDQITKALNNELTEEEISNIQEQTTTNESTTTEDNNEKSKITGYSCLPLLILPLIGVFLLFKR